MKQSSRRIVIHIARQQLSLFQGPELVRTWNVSTAANGAGESFGSECTPRGLHVVRLKIGRDCPLNTVFVGRRPTGEIYTPALAATQPGRDWILTRIIWLSGCESGVNRGRDNDTLRRFIYVHGCPDSEPMGIPLSHGCIRMRNSDITELFDLIDNGTAVEIMENGA